MKHQLQQQLPARTSNKTKKRNVQPKGEMQRNRPNFQAVILAMSMLILIVVMGVLKPVAALSPTRSTGWNKNQNGRV